MNDFDHAAGLATQTVPEVLVDRLGRIAEEQFTWCEWFTTRAISLPGGPTRTSDQVLIVESKEVPELPTMLVQEFQSEHDPEKLDNTLLIAAVFRVFARHGEGETKTKFRVLVGMVSLKGQCPVSTLDMTCMSGAGTLHKVLVWNVADDKAEEALDQVSTRLEPWIWGLLFWIPLMTGAEDPAIIRRWVRLVDEKIADESTKVNLRTVALRFAELAGHFLAWNSLVGDWQVRESIVGNTFRAEGALRTVRKLLLLLVQSKYKGAMTPDFPQTVQQQSEVELLEHWYNLVLEHDTWDGFVQALH